MRRTRTIPALVLPLLIAACSSSTAPDSGAARDGARPGTALADAAPAPTDSTSTARGGNLMGGH